MVSAAVVPSSAEANTIYWNTVPTGVFSTGGNWAGNVAPGSADTAYFGIISGTFNVSFGSSPTTSGLTVASGVVNMNVSTGSSQIYTVTGITSVTGSSELFLNGPLPMTLKGGTVNVEGGTGSAVSQLLGGNGGKLNATSLNIGQSNGNGTVTIGNGVGGLVVTGVTTVGQNGNTGLLYIQGGSTASLAGLLIDSSGAVNTEAAVYVSGGSTLTNAGNLNLGDGTATGQIGVLAVDGSGSVYDQTGSFTTTIGSSTTSVAAVNISSGGIYNTGTGAIAIAANGIINIGAGNTGGTFNANGVANDVGGTINLSSGTLNAASNLNIQGGGVLNISNGNLNLTPGHTLALLGAATANITSSLYATPASTLTLVSGSAAKWNQNPGGSTLEVVGGSTFNVSAGGTLSTDFIFDGITTAGTVNVDGVGSSLVATGTTANFVNRIGSGTAAGTMAFTNGSTGLFVNPLKIGESANNGGGTLTVASGSSVVAGDILLGATGVIGAGSAIVVGSTTANASSITQTGAAVLTMGTTGYVLNNNLNITAGGTFTTGTGATTINPDNQIFINGGSFVSKGDVDVLGGSFSMANILSSSSTPAANHLIYVGSGGQMTLSGSFFAGNGSSITVTGAGTQLTELPVSSGLPFFFFFDEFRISGGSNLLVNGTAKALILGRMEVGQSGAGTAVIDGSGTTLNVLESNPSVIGQDGNGTMTVSNSAVANFKQLYVGYSLDNAATTGTLNIQSNAVVTPVTSNIIVGQGLPSGSTGTINLTGGGMLNMSSGNTISVGEPGRTSTEGMINIAGGTLNDGGTLNVNGGGVVTLNGGTYNAKGNINVFGGRFQYLAGNFNWTAGETLNVSSGGALVINSAYTPPANAVITVTGVGSQASTGALTLINSSFLTVLSGASMTTGQFSITAVGTGNVGAAQIDGPGTTFTASSTVITNPLYNSASYQTFPALTISNGATANLGQVDIANTPGTVFTTAGEMDVLGGFVTTNDLNLANNSYGTAGVSVYGGSLHVTGNLNFSNLTSSPDIIAVGYGGTLLQGTSTILTGIPAQIGSGNISGSGMHVYLSGGSVALGAGFTGQFNFSTGSLGYVGPLDVGGSNMFPSSLDLVTGMSLAVSGAATVYSGSSLTLDGGSISAASYSFNGPFVFNSGTLAFNNLAPGPLVIGSGGFFGSALIMTAGKTVVAENGTTISSNGQLVVNSGAFVTSSLTNAGNVTLTSGQLTVGPLTNQPGGVVNIADGQQLSLTAASTNAGRIVLGGPGARVSGQPVLVNANGGVVTGEGTIASPFVNSAGAQVYPGIGKALTFTGGFENAGQLNLNNGEVDVTGNGLTNDTTGTVNSRGILNTAGIYNYGLFQLSAGTTDVYGNLIGYSGSKVLVSGGSTSTFYNNVTMPAGSEFRVSTASTAVFFGAVTGTNFFTGTGIKDFESGVSSPGLIATPGSTVVENPAIVTATAFDESALTVAGNAIVSFKTGGPVKTGTSTVGSLTMDPGGVLDLTNNDMVIHNGSLSSIAASIASGYNLTGGANWQGVGITSSTAAGNSAHLTALGVIQNAANGVPVFGPANPFDGTGSLTTDVLVKYTWFGDANLDGKVDGSDYSLIDSGYASHGTKSGWYNGDFNYDGTIDGSDYALIDNAFNNQTLNLSAAALVATQSAQAAGPTSVPEPIGVAGVAAGAVTALRRRRRV